MKNEIDSIIDSFYDQLDRVEEIVEFDRQYLEEAIKALNDQKEALEKIGVHNSDHHPDAAISILQALIRSGPEQLKYQSVFNQCLVLQVSYFASAVSSIFNSGLTHYLASPGLLNDSIKKMELKFTLGELMDFGYDLSLDIGRVVSNKSGVSFQDMQSIARGFSKFFDIDIEKDEDVENIIASQAFRHAIVHNGEIVDSKCIRQLQATPKRNFVEKIKENDRIVISHDDLNVVKKSMMNYVKKLKSNLLKEV